jgi:hypothetical protein
LKERRRLDCLEIRTRNDPNLQDRSNDFLAATLVASIMRRHLGAALR